MSLVKTWPELGTWLSCAAVLAVSAATACGEDEANGGGGSAGTAGSAGTGGADGSAGSGGSGIQGVKVAFLGDHGTGFNAKNNFELVAAEGADFLVILGDFDYDDDPEKWDDFIVDTLGPDYPWFAVVGNHDTDAWDGYQQKIEQKLATMQDADCTGEAGVKHSCRYKGLHFVFSGVGLLGDGHEEFLNQELAASSNDFKICAWHMNQREMQLGEKSDSVGWGVYQECNRAGAMIATAHEHSYSRTYTLTDIGNSAAEHGKTGAFDQLVLGPGKTFVFVSGAGGQSLRDYVEDLHANDTWWASGYARNKEISDGELSDASNLLDQSGTLFITFDIEGKQAGGYFKTAGQKRVIDEFRVTLE